MTAVFRPSHHLQPLVDISLPKRLAVSVAARGGITENGEFDTWFADRAQAGASRVDHVPLEELDGWDFQADTGNIVHRSGRFFVIEGLQVRRRGEEGDRWHQPIINQHEIGILGILVKEIDGVLHCLMQAKMEPGNPRSVQLSPTVQATRSNYTRVHRGTSVRYIDYFRNPSMGRVIIDVLQSEHGAWFFQKSNRNMVVEVVEDIEIGADYCWLTLGQLYDLMRCDNLVNMDSRTVLSCLPQPAPWTGDLRDPFRIALAASRDTESGAVLSMTEMMSWFTDCRSAVDIEAHRIPLCEVEGWRHSGGEIAREDGKYFSVVGVDVSAGNREVGRWSQPLIRPHGIGVVALIVRQFCGVLHLLVHARAEGGFLDAVELGPTVQCVPDNYADGAGPAFLDTVLAARGEQVRYEAVHAEEGGRFLHAESRYVVVDADDSIPDQAPAGFAWVTVGQLSELLRHGHYLNVQARTLLVCLNAIG
ncbi:NDP-hexose 2,3-dehydratase family protein [Nocardia alba]|uniref:Oxidase EvaA n=1 Tax=Nocardia alba TaxID=225051 RepID=A0A4V2P9J6_9NOCA|nr:NDP-hexose 2,3-dehydratase family protein [Nocardia alba]TCJ89895.1 oxidase EvaA [Nocardia alba]